MDKTVAFFESYNSIIEQVYEKELNKKNKGNPDKLDITPETVDALIHAAEESWQNTPDSAFEQLTPAEFIKGTGSLDELINIFRQGAVLCHDKLPKVLIGRLKSFGVDTIKAFHRLIATPFDTKNDEELLPVLAVVEILGEWGMAGSEDALLNLLYSYSDEDVIAEYVQTALESMGACVIKPIMAGLLEKGYSENTHQTLLSVLSDVGRNNKTEEIFKILKEYFRSTENKGFAASLLGTYGDGRAVTVLKGYVDRNLSNITPEVFFEIKLAVEMLGGSMSDEELEYIRFSQNL